MRRLALACTLIAPLLFASASARADEAWFEKFKAQATPEQMYRFLYALPKGGDLHNHLSGAGLSEWWWQAALDQQARGYTYYSKVRINNCIPYGSVNEYGNDPYYLLFHTIQQTSYDKLDACQKSEYKRLQDLTAKEKDGWLNSIRLDKPFEGRDEFFSTHWQRLADLDRNPYVMAEILYQNMKAFSAEGLEYLETMNGAFGYLKPDGTLFTPDQTVDILRQRLAQRDAKATGVTVRFQSSILRFAPNAEQQLRTLYAFTDQHRDLYVGINMVGREDNQKGYPLRFLSTLRDLRKHYPDIHLSIHAGEQDEPSNHIRDTLLLGAERIGHGVNLIDEPDMMVLMRNGPYMVEINLISNFMLGYVPDFQHHPFPEYLRIGIPVALSTDDRGMWDSNLTDEYYVAVHEFNLSWDEIVKMGRNSLKYAFVQEPVKEKLLADYDRRVARFAKDFQRKGSAALDDVHPVSYSFTCKHYQICLPRQ
ncbi:adenosine deaminase family protein [Solimonas marina]|uniref:Adenosine deaminase n=1 Tax=Solimonas marina TaxID=2714601 RepID=A0A970B8H6_9GAMM|nr:adenosine deaminase [Solimonas marina]NKF24755.1 adenosine deaminase [Solimonas marina]